MEHLNTALLFVISIGLFGGIIGGWLFQLVRIPQVVGYIAIGLLVGQSGFGVIRAEHVSDLRGFSFFALGVIGFLVGGELKLDVFKKYGRQFTVILLGEGVLAFVLVGVASTLIIYQVYPHVPLAIAAGVILGAIASATDPASTIDVLWEYRSQGILTTSIIAIVALDDGLAMALYGLGTSVSRMLAGGQADVGHQMMAVVIQLGGAIVLGAFAALILALLIRLMTHVDRSVALAIGLIMLVISLAIVWDVDVILAAMTMGFVLTNMAPHRSKHLFELMRSFSIPIYVMFFVLVGARLHVSAMPGWIWLLAFAYVICRSIGKVLGAYLGGRWSGAHDSVRKYLGSALFAQGGVAIGLSIVASQNLSNVMITEGLSLGAVVIAVVTVTTLVVQVLGPATVKLSVRAAGEIGRKITEDDVLKRHSVRDCLVREIECVQESTPLAACMKIFQEQDQFLIPVTDAKNHYCGTITLDGVKNVLSTPEQWGWLIAADVVAHGDSICRDGQSMFDAWTQLNKMGRDQLVVVDDNNRFVGIFDRGRARLVVKKEMSVGSDPAAPPTDTEEAFA